MTAEQNKQTRLAEKFSNKQRLIGLLFSTIHHKPIFADRVMHKKGLENLADYLQYLKKKRKILLLQYLS